MRTHTLRDASEVGDGRWHRLHPLTPVLQGGVALLAILTAALAVLWEGIILPTFLQFFGVDDEGPDSRLWELVGQSLGWIAFGAVLVVVALVLEFWLQWRVHVVKMDADMIEVKRGLLVKSSRRARLDRINTIGVRRPLIPRLLGLAKLDIQAAGNDASVVLAYLPIRVAQDLRRMILAGDGGVHQEHNEEEIQREVEVPLFRYLAALVVSVETVLLFVVITGVTIFAVWAGEMAVWLALVLALFVYVVYLGERMIRSGNFVIDSLEGDIRVSLGLLSTS
ncbi:MAG: PH domain-containing protein, partial [Pontimonas sp.]|nr:PH domain-containing protein [Pontimonas sp.]